MRKKSQSPREGCTQSPALKKKILKKLGHQQERKKKKKKTLNQVGRSNITTKEEKCPRI